jgi:uracil-DNA glycosylase
MLIGEQPGDAEDQEDEPFVGPAGSVLADALEESGIRSEDVYLTNVVKHFRWKPKGKRRLHQTRATRQVRACLPWLEAELATVTQWPGATTPWWRRSTPLLCSVPPTRRS